MRRHTTISAALIFLVAATTAIAQVDPLKERGFAPEKAYQIGDIDSINTFNGNLIVSIPLGGAYPVNGGLTFSIGLTYNGDIWDLTGVTYDSGQTWFTRAEPCSSCNAGPGFMVSLGRLLAPGDPDNRTPLSWTYIGPDASEHVFYTSLHDGEPTYSGYWYPRDGSYLRLKDTANGKDVEFPDDTIRSFNEYQTGKWRINKISDQYGNYVNITYPDANTWQITDMHNRSHYVRFSNGVVTSVELAKFGGGTAQYAISYTQDLINRSCEDSDPYNSDTLYVFRPSSITLPDGSSWTGFTYHTQTCPAPPAKAYPVGLSSRLAGVSMPTGARLEWTYKNYGFLNCSTDPKTIPPTYRCSTIDNTGVETRTLKDPAGSAIGTWTYSNYTHYTEVFTPTHRQWADERILKLLDPQGNATLNYSWIDTNAWDYGLAYQRFDAADAGGRYLSVSQYSGNPTVECILSDPCTITGGTLQRSTYLKYEHDKIPTSGAAQEKRNTNRRVASQRTSYDSDGGRDVISDSFNFDGLGHYRTTVTAGHPDLGPLYRKITNLNSWVGTYKITGDSTYDTANYDAYTQFPGVESPAHNYTTLLPNGWPTNKPWILGSYEYEEQAQYDTAQTPNLTSARQDFCFERDAGGTYAAKPFVLRRRVFTTGTSASATDVVSVFTHDSGGNVYNQRDYGGDMQSLATTALCSLTLPAQDVYRVDNLWQYGAQKYSRYHDQAGNPLTFYSLDLDIDQSTGLPSASRDSAGVQTSLEYDARGRLTWLKPSTANPVGGAWVEYAYTNFAAGSPPTRARARALSHPNNQPTGTPLAGEEYEYDWQGRLVVEKKLLPNQSWPSSGPCTTQCNQRVTELNPMGWKLSVSEWQSYNPATVNKTQYLNYDAFGRPGTIRPPDGSTHDMTVTYSGIRSIGRTVPVATAQGSESPALTTELYDRLGRLASVTEKSGPSNGDVTTYYRYDVGNRLKIATATSGATQTRTFTYDNRGFLLSEQLPELGSAGNGTATYSNYDARGHAGRIQDGAHDLTYCYDRAERLTKLLWPTSTCADANPTNVLRDFTYATANGTGDWKNGKVVQARSHSGPTGSDESVTETYAYGGLGGRTSQRTTAVSLLQPAVETRTLTQTFTWNALGALSWQQYPDDGALADPARTVINAYSNGLLTGVCEGTTPPACTTNFASAISYYPNLMVNTINHANTVNVTYTKDDFDQRRPKAIATANATSNWSSGNYGYDGAGNVKAVGADWHTYDLVSRLTGGSFAAWGQGTKTHGASYNAFGFMLTLVTNGSTQNFTPDLAGANNHISGVSYDGAGNMSGWGGYTYTWDRVDQLTGLVGPGIGQHAYLYTADGERIVDREVNGGTTTVKLWVRGLDAKVLREYARSGSTWSWTKDYTYRDGLLLASIDSTETRHFALDHLGTPRLTTGPAGATRAGHTYYPFGMEASSTTQDTERMKFTGHERDLQGTPSSQTDDLDYMHARYYSFNIARFLSVDRGRIRPASPQSWNKYAYVMGRPLTYADPTGLDGLGFSDYATAVGEAAADTADQVGFMLAYPILKVGSGFLNDDPGEVAVGTGLIALDAVIGGGAKALSAARFGFTSRANFLSHFETHGAEYGALTAEQYGMAAADLLRARASGAGVQTVEAKNGLAYVYRESTRDFALVNKAGDIVSFHKMRLKEWERLVKKLLTRDEAHAAASATGTK